ncbi:MAG: hypothetical protein V3V33_11545 [Candidatus Lokiarchaeia archaeon]
MKVAFNKIKITPKDYIGMPMAGYTRPNPCLGKLDDIYAYGVLIEETGLEDKKKQILLISLDLLKVPLVLANYIKKQIINNFKFLEQEYIFIHATHTHSAPDLTGEFYWPGGTFNFLKGIMFGANRNDRYIVWFTRQIVKMIAVMYKKIKTCKLAWKKKPFNPQIVIHRKFPTKELKLELGVIVFRSLDSNELIGFIINYSCHPTTLSYLNNKLSADYPGRIVFKIGELTNDRIEIAFFNGPAGNLNPITTCGTNYEKLEKNKVLVYDQLGTYVHTEKIGYKIGEEALKLAESIPIDAFFENLKLSTCLKNIWIPLKDFKYFSKTWFMNKLKFVLKKHFLIPISRVIQVNFPKFTIKHYSFKSRAKSIVQVLNFEVFKNSRKNSKVFDMIFVPGELYEEIGENLLENAPQGEKNTFIFQNVNDWIGYLFPVEDYIEQGGWEAFAGFSPICGHYIETSILELFKEIKDKTLSKKF